jgi:hypothetical protein
MKIQITPKINQEFNKNWKKITSNSAYLVPETVDDFKSLGPFPYFEIKNLWVFPKEHTADAIRHFTKYVHKIVGGNLFSWETVSSAIREEIKLFFETQSKHNNDWHLNHLLESISSKNKKRIFIRSISGLKIENFDGIHRGIWQLIPFSEKEINKYSNLETDNDKWKLQVKEYLTKNFKNKTCLLIESSGDLDTAKKIAQKIASFVVNTFRYFICVHTIGAGRVHDVGIMLDSLCSNHGLNSFSFDKENNTSTMLGYGSKYRQEYPLNKENLDILKSEWGADKIWNLNEKEELNDLESSIIASILWLGDAHQENDINSAYVKYWIAIEALLTGHKKEDVTNRIKNTIPIMISQVSQDLPSKTKVDKAYELRCKVIHCGIQDIVNKSDLTEVCAWATQCLSVCIQLLDMGYTDRKQIEIQADRMNKSKKRQPRH